MFEVRATFPFNSETFAEFSERLRNSTAFKTSFSGAGACRDMDGGREIGWHVPTFDDAQDLKRDLEKAGVESLIVRIKEVTSN